MLKKIIVECKPDEVLAKSLGCNKKEIAHQPNKGEVCNLLIKSNILIAIIDEDPNSHQPNLLSKFKLIEEKFDIRKMYLRSESKTILVIKPRLEEWILKRCRLSGINPKAYYLPSNNKEFKDVLNYQLGKFELLVDGLLQKKDEGLLYLRKQIRIS